MSAKDKENVYKKAGLGKPVGFGERPALIVVDFQKGFTKAESALGGDLGAEVLQTKKLADACRKKNVKVVYTRVGYNKDGSDLTTWSLKVPGLLEYTRDTWFYEYDERLGIQPEDYLIEKHAPSAFFGTHLVPMLIALHIDTVILTGCTVGGCLYATAIDALSYGYRPMIVTDCAGDRSQETKEIFMWNMGMKYGDLMSCDEVIGVIDKLKPMQYTMLR